MSYPINYDDISVNTEFYSELAEIHKEAESYLKNFKWCTEIKSCSLYTNIGKVFCIFLFEIDNIASREDNFLWIIVGDIPPMYLDSFGVKSTREVIETYVNLAEQWINNIKAGEPIDKCYPFNVAPTSELAGLLEKRVYFMKSELMNSIDNIRLKA